MRTFDLKIPVVIAIFLLCSVAVGVALGEGAYGDILTIAGILVLIFYLLVVHRYTWQIVLLFTAIDMGYNPLNFSMGSLEIACLLSFGLLLIYSWQRKRYPLPLEFDTPSFFILRGGIFALLVYVSFHFLYNYYSPLNPADYALKNAVKSYFQAFAPLALLYYFLRYPVGIRPRDNFLRIIGGVVLFGLCLNIVFQSYFITHGGDLSDSRLNPAALISIPFLNATPNIYTLRGLGPLAVLISAIFLTEPRTRSRFFPSRLMAASLGIVGLGASFMSGGRSSAIFAFVFLAAVLLLRGRIIVAGLAVCLLGISALAINAFSDSIVRDTPFIVQRSVNWALPEKDATATGNIDSSTDWRTTLFKRALAEWSSTPRIFWFGRATYEYSEADRIAETLNGYEGSMTVSLRRGVTHNLITDLLVTTGLVGAVLYFFVCASLIAFLYGIWRRSEPATAERPLALVCFVYTGFMISFGVVGGGYLSALGVWLIVILAARIHRQAQECLPLPSQEAATPSAITKLRQLV